MDLGAKPYRIFTRIADLGSFSRAAESLNMSQPALSSQLRELERQLGFALFNRTSRRVELTLEGAQFLGNARRMVLEADFALTAAQDIRSKPLRIGVAHYTQLIPERTALTDGFVAANPDIQVRIEPRHPRQLSDDLERGAIDLAITLQVEGATQESLIERLPSTFDSLAIGRKGVGLAVPHGDPLAGSGPIRPADLADRRIVTFFRGHGVAVIDAVVFALTAWGAAIERPPEGDAQSIRRYAAIAGLPCVDLGWFPVPADCVSAAALEPVAIDWSLTTSLAVLSVPGKSGPATERFLAHCRTGGMA